MKITYAPLEGITGYIYRNIHHDFFGGIDRYYAPFIDAKKDGCVKKRDIKDILPEYNKKISLVPQILAANATNFLLTEKIIEDLGYQEVNLNLGCPSRTVVTKKKGSGFLAYPEELDRFFDEVFQKINVQLSVKTRLGMQQEEEFETILKIYNKYPIKELIIHPRLQTDFYQKDIHMNVFLQAKEHANMKVTYNGDITDLTSFEHVNRTSKTIDSFMIGRGLLINPDLASQIKGQNPVKKEVIWDFFVSLLEAYEQYLSGERNLMFKMKEISLFLMKAFANYEKYEKSIKKAQHVRELKTAFYLLVQNESRLIQ